MCKYCMNNSFLTQIDVLSTLLSGLPLTMTEPKQLFRQGTGPVVNRCPLSALATELLPCDH